MTRRSNRPARRPDAEFLNTQHEIADLLVRNDFNVAVVHQL